MEINYISDCSEEQVNNVVRVDRYCCCIPQWKICIRKTEKQRQDGASDNGKKER